MLNGRCRTPAGSSGRGLPERWNATPEEAGGTFPCDALAPGGFIALTRAIDVETSPPLVFRWLCQLRAAPYSYDWIDNFGQYLALAWGDVIMMRKQLLTLKERAESSASR